jgi:hypothetical protein
MAYMQTEEISANYLDVEQERKFPPSWKNSLVCCAASFHQRAARDIGQGK